MLLGLSVMWGMTLKYYMYVGRTDLLGHAWFAENLINGGHITQVFELYQAFPLWHILIGTLYLMSGMPVDVSRILYMASGLIYFMLPVALYLVAMRLFHDRKIALISALILMLTPVVLIYGTYSIARSIVPFFMIVLIAVLLNRSNKSWFPLAMFFTLVIIIFHTVSIAFVLVMLGMLYVLQKILARGETRPIVTFKYLLASGVLTLAYWALPGRELLDTVIGNVLDSPPSGVLTKSVVSAPLTELLNYIQFTPYIFFIILGVLIILRSKRFGNNAKLFAIMALLFIPIAFPGPTMLINKLNANFNVERFDEYTFLFMGLAAATGFVMLYNRPGRLLKALCVVIFAVMILLSVSNDFVASDNPLVKRPFYTSYLRESEINSYDVITNITSTSTGYMLSDYVMARYMQFSPNSDKDESIRVYPNAKASDNAFLRNSTRDIILIREGELQNRPLKLYNSTRPVFSTNSTSSAFDYYYRGNPIYNSINNLSRIFDSQTVRGYN
jgi:hypothetical protein